MKLKTKSLRWSAGLPVAMLNKKTARKIGVHTKDRISINTFSRKPKEISTIVDIVDDLVKENEIAISSEIKEVLNLKKASYVNVDLTETPKSLSYIKKKFNKKILSKNEIYEIIKDIVNNSLSEAEIALFISAMHEQGMNINETISLIKAILKSGNSLKLDDKYVADKHCIGGIPGNRTTPIVISICAAAGMTMPKTSSRAITSAAGTADVIETIAKIEFSINKLKRILKKTNACMIWGGGLGLVPADSKIIRVEKALKLDPEAQLLASIISKKLAVGSKFILIDIPYGKYAKVNRQRAENLKKKFEELGRYFKRKMRVVLTNGSQPIGNGIGPALELIDIINILDPKKQGPKDLEDKSIFLAGQLFEMTKIAKKGEGIDLAKQILYSGKAFKKFRRIIKAQKGKIKRLKSFKYNKHILATSSGKILSINNKKINHLARLAGCPNDKYAGIYLYHHLRERVKKGEKILTIYAESKPRLKEALKFYNSKKPITIS